MAQEHPERALLLRIHADQLDNVAVDTNPLATALGMRIKALPSLGQITVTFEVGAAFSQGDGYVQGGIFATMLDFGLAFAAMSATPAGRTVSTIGLTVNYLRPARPGHFVVEAVVEKMGRSVAVSRASLSDSEGRLVATASSPLAVLAFPAERG